MDVRQRQWLLASERFVQSVLEVARQDDRTDLVIPFWIALASVGCLVQNHAYHTFKARREIREESPVASEVEPQSSRNLVSRNGGVSVFSFMVARVLGSAVLVGFSLLEVIKAGSGTRRSGDNRHPSELFVYGSLLMANLYAFVLALAAIFFHSWRKSLIRHNIIVLSSELAIYAFRNVWPLATYTGEPLDLAAGWLLWAKMATLFFTAFIVPLFIPNIYTPYDPKHPEMVPHPEQTASIISLRTYSYFDAVFRAVNKVDHLPVSELPPLADYDKAENVSKTLSRYIDENKVRGGRHIAFAFLRSFGSQYLKAFFGTVLYSISHLAEPIIVNRLLTILESSGNIVTGVRPWVWILFLLIFPVMGSMGYQFCAVLMQRTLCNMEAILTQLFFEYSLKIRVKADAPDERPAEPKSKRTSTSFVGRLTNLITIDMENLMAAREFFQFFWVTPFQIIGGSIFLYTLLGWSAFVGLGVMVLSLPLPGWLAKISRDVQEEKMRKTDSRTQTVTETINVLRMIKMFGWERKVQGRIDEKREEEIKWVLKGRLLELFIQIIIFTIPTIAMMSTFATATLVLKIELTASKVFSTIILFDTIRIQLMTMNSLAGQIIRGKVSIDRINAFFKESEFLDAFSPDQASHPKPRHDSVFVGFKDATFTWTPGDGPSGTDTPTKFKLSIPGELRFVKGGINVVVGPTGSGKTSLLMALLGEMYFVPTQPDSMYNLPRGGGVSFCIQESWVQNETIRDNILFNSPYEEGRYMKVLHQCALEQDLELFEAGDLTEVGERGLTLSGGQKARLTLARAIYARTDIILLDDVLAALDVHTAVWIVNKCLKGELVKGRTIILVTHNIALAIPTADFVVSVTADGVVTGRHGHDIVDTLASNPDMQAESQYDEVSHNGNADVIDAYDGSKKPVQATGKLIAAEEIHRGHGAWKPMKFFMEALGGDHLVAFLTLWMGGSLLEMILHSFNVWFLGYWSDQYERRRSADIQVLRYMIGYVLLVLARILAWLDETPVSRILQRMTLDMDVIDVRLMRSFNSLQVGVLVMIVNLVSAVMFVPLFTIPGLFTAILALFVGRIYVKAQMSVRREMSNAKAPLLAHFTAAVAGMVSIRAYGAGPALEVELRRRIDHYVRLSRLYHDLNRWINIRIDLIRGIFAASLAAYLTYASTISAANVGFSLNRAVEFCQVMLYTVRQYNMFLIETNSLERVVAYTEIEQEPKPTEGGRPPAAWPASGDIKVEGLTARYSKSGPAVLHSITFHLTSGERVGVVGRTGSGKSSLTLALLRCIPTQGAVYFDGLDTRHINLDALRSNITIIPQMPELLSGTLRYNLDPFGDYDDAVLNDALRASGLYLSSQDNGVGSPLNLDSRIASGGSNVSVGQRQIIALARAIVRSSKLLILDEATSAIDHETDNIIQNTLRKELGPDVTVLTVAHRLHTIMDADRVLVLDAGRIVEFASPADLLDRPGSMFKSLVDKSKDKDHLYEVARRTVNSQ